MREEPREQDECGCCFYSTYLLNGKFFVSQKNANFAIVEPDGRKLTIRPSENMIRTILNNFLLMENYGYSRMNGRNGRFENRFAPRSSGGSQWNGRYGTFSGSEQFRTAGGRDTNGYDVIGYSTYPEDLRKKRRRKIVFWGVLISVALSYGYYKITGWTSKSSEQQDSAALELLETDEPSKSDGMATLGDDEDYLSESESDDEDLYDDDDYLSENGLDDEDEDANAVSSDRRTEGNASRSENSTVSTLSGVDIDETVLIDPYICYCYAKDYTTIIGTYKEKTFKFELDVSSENSIVSEESRVSLDGRNAKITDSAGRSYCSLLFESIACIKIGGVEVAEKTKPSSAPELSLTFIDKNYVTTVYEFYPKGTDSYYVFKNGEYMNFYVYATEIFNDGGSDTYSYGYWRAYELLNQAITDNMNGIYDL